MTAPERLDSFMARAVAAYYAGPRDPFGRAGDFTTAPEISQAFGECLGLWAAVTWEMMGRPDPVLLVELGPGRGTLMADALRAAAEVAAPFRAALRVHLVEASPRLRDAQRARLGRAVAAWHEDFAGVPPGPAIVLANEFFDALPIRQFVRRGDGWAERFVADGAFVERPVAAVDAPPSADGPEDAARETGGALPVRGVARGGLARPPDGTPDGAMGAMPGTDRAAQDGARPPPTGAEDDTARTASRIGRATAARPAVQGAAPPLPAVAPEGAVQEVSEAGRALAAALAVRLAAQGGAALALDYGPAASGFGDSLQAVRGHGATDPLAEPGAADLTAHVDFAALAAAARAAGAAVHGPLPQGLFLGRLGLTSRAAMLAGAAQRDARTSGQGHERAGLILSGAERLVAPERMGRLFKALCLCDPALPPPPGFEAA